MMWSAKVAQKNNSSKMDTNRTIVLTSRSLSGSYRSCRAIAPCDDTKSERTLRTIGNNLDVTRPPSPSLKSEKSDDPAPNDPNYFESKSGRSGLIRRFFGWTVDRPKQILVSEELLTKQAIEVQLAKDSASQMKVLLANMAHDLKTVSRSFFCRKILVPY